MRWPWQRKTAPVRTPAAPTAVPTHRSDWRRVGTLRPTADAHAPTLAPTGLPVLASTRSLLHRERTESPQAPAGRVSGLVRISPVTQPDPLSIVPAPVRATVAARPVRSTLTRAVAAYVGEPRVPAVPHRAPGWLRNAPPQVITPLDAFASPMETKSPPEMTLLDSWTTKPPAFDQEPPDAVDEPVALPPTPPIRRRRPGLGLPLPPGERPPTHVSQPVEQPRQQQPPPMVVDAPAPTVQEAPTLVHPTVVPGRFSARVPADLAETFERAYGVEVADVVVDRSPAAASRAKAMGAKAFAHHDLIVLPEEVGPVEAVEARALLGHELAHVVQQRTIGPVPTESGPDGQRLEAAARAVEDWVRAGAAGPPPPAVPPEPGAPPRSSQRSGPPPARRRATAGPPSSAGAPQRAPAGVATDPAAPPRTTARVVTSTSAAPATSATGTAPAASLVHPATRPADHDPLNPRDGHEFGGLVRDSFANLGLDMFGMGSVLQHQNQPAATTTSTTGPTTTPAATGGTQGQVSQPATGAAFNRDARRQQLTEDTLQRINLVRAQQGEPATSELPETELAAIEMQLDAEQGRSGGGQNSGLPVIHNAAELREQVRLGAGELLGAFIGYNPVDAAERQHHETQAHQQNQPNTPTATGGAGTPGATQQGATPGAHPDTPAPEPTGTELARLYDRIHTRLLRELLVGRERAGVLMDFR